MPNWHRSLGSFHSDVCFEARQVGWFELVGGDQDCYFAIEYLRKDLILFLDVVYIGSKMVEPWESNPVSFMWLVRVDDYDGLGKTTEIAFTNKDPHLQPGGMGLAPLSLVYPEL